MGLRPLEICLLLQCGDRLRSSESDVYRRQILTTKVDPRAVRVKYMRVHVNGVHQLFRNILHLREVHDAMTTKYIVL